MKLFGLIGKNIDYSFSRTYFSEKFKQQQLDCKYKNFDLESIEKFSHIFDTKTISGLNVTIPYKETVIPYLNALDSEAEAIGAVNTIQIKNNKLIGYNTDHYGFKTSLIPHLNSLHKKALILGTGGASKAVVYALESLGIETKFVSRSKKIIDTLIYEDLSVSDIQKHTLIVNCTPLGTHPKTDECPPIPYAGIGKNHLLYDLIYNPEETKFLSIGKKAGANTLNGLEMLKLQAEKSWEIWHY
jgi:shikimate dehydrogenase